MRARTFFSTSIMSVAARTSSMSLRRRSAGSRISSRSCLSVFFRLRCAATVSARRPGSVMLATECRISEGTRRSSFT